MNRRIMRKSVCVFALWLLSSGAFAAQLHVEDYPLSSKNYEGVDVNCVIGGTLSFSDWRSGVSLSNPTLSSRIKSEKIATIEIKVPNFDDLGSIDPFVLAARKRAAKLGANLVSYDNGVANKVTKRISMTTYTAYRVTCIEHLVPGSLLDQLSRPVPDNDEFERSVEKETPSCALKEKPAPDKSLP